MPFNTTNKDHCSLLLYLESCAVDHFGRIDLRKMNNVDQDIVREWGSEGFVAFGRIQWADVTPDGGCWCTLSEAAFTAAGILRKERAQRMWSKRRWKTTCEVAAEALEGEKSLAEARDEG